MNNVIRYGSRTFGEIRADLVNLIKETYPEVLSDFSDSSVGAMLIDLNAGVGNNLSMNTDRVFNETQLGNAQLRSSLLGIAKNMGFNIPASRPSVTVIDLTVTIPVLGDKPDASYYPILAAGAQVLGGGKTFETYEAIDWNSPLSNLGNPNRSIVPNYDSNGIIVSYNVTKREVVTNGSTNIYKRIITSDDVTPFFKIMLPETNVIGVDGIILLEGTNWNTLPEYNRFNEPKDKYYEVEYLAQQKIFIEDYSAPTKQTDGLKAAKWIDVTKKFIVEFTSAGFCEITFGSGDSETNAFKSGMIKAGVTNRAFLDNFLNNTSLGEKLRAGYTLFVKYKTGGGSSSNVGSNVLTQLGSRKLKSVGSRYDVNQAVERSLKVTNPIPAIGGNDGLTIEQIRHLISRNFSSQGRDVTLTDYLLDVYKMPGKFGSPYRANAHKENNKIVISILGIDAANKLSNVSNSLLKENIAEYISGNRMVNDYVEIRDGRILNLAIDIDVHVDNVSDTQIANSIINVVKEYFTVSNYEMNSDIFLGQLQNKILELAGVVNIIKIKVYNKIGKQYSNNRTSQQIIDIATGEINIVNNTIYSNVNSMFEIKYPEKDIRVFLRKKVRM